MWLNRAIQADYSQEAAPEKDVFVPAIVRGRGTNGNETVVKAVVWKIHPSTVVSLIDTKRESDLEKLQSINVYTLRSYFPAWMFYEDEATTYRYLIKSGLSKDFARAATPAAHAHVRMIVESDVEEDEKVSRIAALVRGVLADGWGEASTSDMTGPESRLEKAVSPLPIGPPLTVPSHGAEKYDGREKSGDIYEFIERVYAHSPGREPLTLEFLREYDFQALTAFRSRRRSAPIPPLLLVLTDQEWGTKEESLLAKYKVDMSSEEGAADGKRLMSAISNYLYPRRP